MASSLVSGFARLRIAPAALTFRQNGVCAAQRVAVTVPVPRAVAVAAEPVVCGKLKTRKAAAKRYKVTGSGKVKARRSGKQHMNEKKGKDRKRELGKEFVVSKRDVQRNVIGALPYAKIDASKHKN